MASTQPGLRLQQTKLLIPRVHPEVIKHSSLTNKFDDGLDSRLILVTAPGGYGKTTLLSNYIQQSEVPVKWVSLDVRDNNPIRFWSYFIAAHQTLDASLGKSAQVMLQSHQTPPIENIMVLSRI
jgi:LuxR family maltose regulon positive regulatory protein